MTIGRIAYQGDYKYQLQETYYVLLPQLKDYRFDADYVSVGDYGMLMVKNKYAWDGPSGPVLDTKENMRASLVHDALYQLMRLEWLPTSFRKTADEIFRDICVEDGVTRWRAWTWYYGLRIGGGTAADPQHKKVTVYAPKL